MSDEELQITPAKRKNLAFLRLTNPTDGELIKAIRFRDLTTHKLGSPEYPQSLFHVDKGYILDCDHSQFELIGCVVDVTCEDHENMQDIQCLYCGAWLYKRLNGPLENKLSLQFWFGSGPSVGGRSK